MSSHQPSLGAVYASPNSNKTFESPLPSLPHQADVQGKTTYLSCLRSSIVAMQGDVNNFLTEKMEQDKAAESGKANAKDEKAEEMYGEEGGEEE
ncbi:hypothetical protein MBLNU230_g8399t1 [Neophaeotheca triangularis]